MKAHRYLTADWHIGTGPEHDEDLLRGVREIRAHMDQAFSDNPLRKIVLDIAGDVFDKPRPLPTHYDTFYAALEILLRPKYREQVTVNVFPGNHDKTTGMDGAFDAFQSDLFREFRNLHFIVQPKWDIEDESLVIRWPFGEMPIAQEVNKILDAQQGKLFQKVVLITHFDAPGAESSSEREIQIGNVGSLPVLTNVDLIWTGHIHKHQKFKIGKTVGYYPGALTRVTHAEVDDDKGFIYSANGFDAIEFVPRVADRKFVTKEIDLNKESLDEWLQGVSTVKATGVTFAFRVRVKGQAAQLAAVDKIDMVQKLKGTGVFDTVKIEFQTEQQTRQEAKAVARGATFEAYEKRWIEKQYPKGQRKAAHAKLGQWLAAVAKTEAERLYHDLRLIGFYVEDFQAIQKADLTIGDHDTIGIMGAVKAVFSQSNGTGKSSLMEALRFGLYGKTRFTKQSSAIRDGAETAIVSLDFASSRGALAIQRVMTQKATQVTVTLDGRVLAKGKEATQWVETNLGLSLRAFDNIVFFGDNRHGIIGATATERLKTLQEPLPLERYEAAQKLATAERRELDKAVVGARAVIEDVESDVLSEEDVEAHRVVAAETPGRVQTLQDEIAALSAQIAGVAESQKAHAAMKSAVDGTRKSRDQAVAEVKKIKLKVEALKTERAKIVAPGAGELEAWQQESTEQGKVLDRLRDELSGLKANIKTGRERHEKTKSGECPTCGAVISADHIEQHEIELTKLVQQSEKGQTQVNEALADIERLEHLIEKAEQAFDNTERLDAESARQTEALTFHEQQATEHGKRLGEQEKALAELAKGLVDTSERETVKRQLSDELDNQQDMLHDAQSAIRDHEKAVARLVGVKQELEKASEDLTLVVGLMEALSPRGIPSLVVQSIVEEINDAIPGCVEEFDFWQPISVWLEPSETGVAVYSQINRKVQREYEGLSKGEKEITNFVFTAAYRKVLQNLIDISYSFVVCDEAIDSLDNANQRKIIDYFKRSNLQAFCITHSDLKDSFTKLAVIQSDGKSATVAMR